MPAELVLNYDLTTWVMIDPLEDEPQQWATTEAHALLEETGVAPDAHEVTHLATVLLRAWEGLDDLAGFILLHLPNPYGDPGPIARLTALDASDGSLEAARELAGADDPDLPEPAVVDTLSTPLGTALRCRRLIVAPARGPRLLRRAPQVSAAVNYVWHLPALNTDILLQCASHDPAALAAIQHDLDALARAVAIEHTD